MDIKEKRKRIEEKCVTMMKLIDPSGYNEKKYRNFFAQMNDNQFTKFMNDLRDNPKANIRIDIEEFGDGSRVLKYENIEKALEYLKVPLFEYVYMPHQSTDPNRPISTKNRVLVGYLNIKRPQQLVSKKTNLTISDTERDEVLGTVKGESKVGTTTSIETELLAGIGCGDDILPEICGARGDNQSAYDQMLSSISMNGSVSLENIQTSVYDKPSLLVADMFFMMMGLKTDLISESYYSTDKVISAMSNI